MIAMVLICGFSKHCEYRCQNQRSLAICCKFVIVTLNWTFCSGSPLPLSSMFSHYGSTFHPTHACVCPQNNITDRSEAENQLFLQRAFNTSLKLALGGDSPTIALPSVGPSNLSQPMCNLSTFNVSISLDLMDAYVQMGLKVQSFFHYLVFQHIMYNVKSTNNKLPTSKVSNTNIQQEAPIAYFYFTTVLNY